MKFETKYNYSAGMVFGRLTILKASDVKQKGHKAWVCICKCGKEKIVSTGHLTHGRVRSCGCLLRESARSRENKHRTHGLSRTPEYQALASAISRCKPTSADRVDYFDRGIFVCTEWRDLKSGGFEAFHAYLLSSGVGLRLSALYSLDRIDNDKGYEPGNIRWATDVTQIRNQRRKRIEQFSLETLISEIQKHGYTVTKNI